MGVEEIPDAEDQDKRDARTKVFDVRISDAKRMIRDMSGMAAIERSVQD